MPLATITNEVMRHLPAALRPNPHNLDEHVMQLATDGWTATDIVDAVIADRPREPGHVVAQVRRLTTQPAPRPTTPEPTTPTGHRPCHEHGGDCELCYCHGLPPIHHVTIPMPDHIKAQLGNGII